MRYEEIRYMWLVVFFDLPVGSKKQRKIATRFRKFLIDEGYFMLQWSVYARICRGQDGISKHLSHLGGNLPHEGNIRALQVTDRQYSRMKMLVGSVSKSEKEAGKQLVLL